MKILSIHWFSSAFIRERRHWRPESSSTRENPRMTMCLKRPIFISNTSSELPLTPRPLSTYQHETTHTPICNHGWAHANHCYTCSTDSWSSNLSNIMEIMLFRWFLGMVYALQSWYWQECSVMFSLWCMTKVRLADCLVSQSSPSLSLSTHHPGPSQTVEGMAVKVEKYNPPSRSFSDSRRNGGEGREVQSMRGNRCRDFEARCLPVAYQY